MLHQLQHHVRSFLRAHADLPNGFQQQLDGSSHPHSPTSTTSTTPAGMDEDGNDTGREEELNRKEGERFLKEQTIFRERLSLFSTGDLSIASFNSLLLLLNISVSDLRSNELFHAIQNQFIPRLSLLQFQQFIFEEDLTPAPSHPPLLHSPSTSAPSPSPPIAPPSAHTKRVQELAHSIEMMLTVVTQRKQLVQHGNAMRYQKYFQFQTALECLQQDLAAPTAASVTANGHDGGVLLDPDQSFSSISSTSIHSFKILSPSLTSTTSSSSNHSGSHSHSGSGSHTGSTGSSSSLSLPLNKGVGTTHRIASLAMNRNLMHLDEFKHPSQRARLHVTPPPSAPNGDTTRSNEKRKNQSGQPYYDDSDSNNSPPPRPKSLRAQIAAASAGGGGWIVPSIMTELDGDPPRPPLADEEKGTSVAPPLSKRHSPPSRHTTSGGGGKSFEMSDNGYDSGDFYPHLVAQRKRSFRGEIRVRRSNTSEELSRAYDSWTFSDDEHLSLDKQQEIKAVINNDPNDL
jgi:hypothetical protein